LHAEKKEICSILGVQMPMKRLTADQQSLFDSSTACTECGVSYSDKNKKVRHHVTGDFVAPLCRNCNLQVKPRQASISKKSFCEA